MDKAVGDGQAREVVGGCRSIEEARLVDSAKEGVGQRKPVTFTHQSPLLHPLFMSNALVPLPSLTLSDPTDAVLLLHRLHSEAQLPRDPHNHAMITSKERPVPSSLAASRSLILEHNISNSVQITNSSHHLRSAAKSKDRSPEAVIRPKVKQRRYRQVLYDDRH